MALPILNISSTRFTGMTPIYKQFCELERLLKNSLSITPNNKSQSLMIDNLPKHHAYIPYIIIKNNNMFNIDQFKTRNKSSVTIEPDNIVQIYDINNNEEKEKQLKKIHDEGQLILRDIISNTKDLVKKYPHKYQAQLAVEAGLTKEKLHDQNHVMECILNIMIQQNIISKRKEGRNAYFSMKIDKDYEVLQYVKSKSYASKLEALCAQVMRDTNVDFRQQIRIPELGKLRIDFQADIDGHELYIEVDGAQHYKWIQYFHKTREDFLNQQKRDQRKNDYFRKTEKDFIRLRFDDDIPGLLKQKITEIKNENK